MEAILKTIYRQPQGASLQDVMDGAVEGTPVQIVFPALHKEPEPPAAVYLTGNDMRAGHTYIFEVKKYMTERTTSLEFDFMQQWNNDIPMPLKIMRGLVIKETRGMLYMRCQATALHTDRCMKCGKPLSHPISMLYGLGPECGQHFYIKPPMTDEEYRRGIASIVEKLHSIQWEGWVIKSAVERAKEVV